MKITRLGVSIVFSWQRISFIQKKNNNHFLEAYKKLGVIPPPDFPGAKIAEIVDFVSYIHTGNFQIDFSNSAINLFPSICNLSGNGASVTFFYLLLPVVNFYYIDCIFMIKWKDFYICIYI